MTRAPLRGGDLKGVDLVLAIHKHSDHLDPGTLPDLLAASPGARARAARVAPRPRRAAGPARRAADRDRRRAIAWSGPGSGCARCPRPTSGSTAMPTGVIFTWGTSSSARASGCIIAGTAWRTRDSPSELGTEPFDVLFLPINGRDPARGVPGNMTAAEAVDLATRGPAAVRRAASLRYVHFQYGSRRGFRGRGPPAAAGGRAANLAMRRALGDHAVSVTLGIDIGTSGTKTLAIDERGTILASASAEYPCSHPRPGWSEQDPAALVGRDGRDRSGGPGGGQVHADGRRRDRPVAGRCTARSSSTTPAR